MYLKKTKENSNEIHHLPKEDQLIWLMEEYGDMVMRLAYTYLKEKQLAEDISQEVFISCYKSLDQFQSRSTYKTWLYRITVNKCKDLLKSWSYKNIQYKDFIFSIIKGRTNSIEDRMEELEDQALLFEKILALPIKLREVIILHYYEELSINEMADLLSQNANTVKTRLFRARNLLKLSFEEENSHEK
ncbi:sigma-70 family RNA polymerase sigma factor [Bacillus sp. CGMCC 1.16607]|uniref:sigma-70 family RNA polymerase sigma factor n=1 Tax=Bacillus sp. CGMCC 1.16607 TaxID=3351842 RepID=UPI003641C9F7